MSFRRSISWTAALRDLRTDRAQISLNERRAHNRREAFIKIAIDRARLATRSSPFFVAGRYDRRAIMCTALATAKARRTITGDAWKLCLSAALKGTWQVAKIARLSALRHQPDDASLIQEPLLRSVSATLGGRISQLGRGSVAFVPSQPPYSPVHQHHGRTKPLLPRAPFGTPPVSC